MTFIFSAIIHLLSLLTIHNIKAQNKISTTPAPIPIPSPLPTLTPVPTPTIPLPSKTPVPTKKPTPAKKIQPINQLLNEVNLFRKDNGQPSIQVNSILCTVATNRINELIRLGKLDNHEGYGAYRDLLSHNFNQWWETIFEASPQKNSHDVVYTYWANSPPHKGALISNATHGCGAEKNGFAVFELGRK